MARGGGAGVGERGGAPLLGGSRKRGRGERVAAIFRGAPTARRHSASCKHTVNSRLGRVGGGGADPNKVAAGGARVVPSRARAAGRESEQPQARPPRPPQRPHPQRRLKERHWHKKQGARTSPAPPLSLPPRPLALAAPAAAPAVVPPVPVPVPVPIPVPVAVSIVVPARVWRGKRGGVGRSPLLAATLPPGHPHPYTYHAGGGRGRGPGHRQRPCPWRGSRRQSRRGHGRGGRASARVGRQGRRRGRPAWGWGGVDGSARVVACGPCTPAGAGKGARGDQPALAP